MRHEDRSLFNRLKKYPNLLIRVYHYYGDYFIITTNPATEQIIRNKRIKNISHKGYDKKNVKYNRS